MRPSLEAVLLLLLCGCASAPHHAVRPVATQPVPAWSAPAHGDCPMTRALDGRAICAPARPASVAAAGAARPLLPAQRDITPTRDYVVIGSFADRDNAERWARGNAEFGTAVRRVQTAGKPLYRVVVGPLDVGDSAALMREILTSIGLGGSWTLALCAGPGTSCEPADRLDAASVAAMAER